MNTVLMSIFGPRYRPYRGTVSTRVWHKVPRLLGKRLRYWVLVYEGGRHMLRDEEVPAVPFTVVLQRSGQELRGVNR